MSVDLFFDRGFYHRARDFNEGAPTGDTIYVPAQDYAHIVFPRSGYPAFIRLKRALDHDAVAVGLFSQDEFKLASAEASKRGGSNIADLRRSQIGEYQKAEPAKKLEPV